MKQKKAWKLALLVEAATQLGTAEALYKIADEMIRSINTGVGDTPAVMGQLEGRDHSEVTFYGGFSYDKE
jgi:hypothetical protein